MSQVVISVTLLGNVEGGVDDESGFYFELEKALGQVAQEFGLNAHIDDVHDNADGGLMQLDDFEKAWGIVKYDTNRIRGNNFGEKFNRKLDSLRPGSKGVPKKFGDMTPTTGGEEHNRKVMADILETDNDGIEDEYGRLKDMFDWEPASIPDSSSQALGSKGLIERFKRAGPTPRGPVKKMNGAEDFVEEVRDLVEQGMPVMEAVQQVCRLVGCKGRDLMRAYTEAYR